MNLIPVETLMSIKNGICPICGKNLYRNDDLITEEKILVCCGKPQHPFHLNIFMKCLTLYEEDKLAYLKQLENNQE